MLDFLLHSDPAPAGVPQSRPRFWRIEISDNLFGEYSVLREWGPSGCRGRQQVVWFSNLRDACMAAERWRRRVVRRGYSVTRASSLQALESPRG